MAGGESVRSEGKEQTRPVSAGPVGSGEDCGLYSECEPGQVLSHGGLFYDWGFKDTG